MGEINKKKVDETWKQQAEREKASDDSGGTGAPEQQASPQEHGGHAHEDAGRTPEARFDVFVSSLAMEALMAMGDVPHPSTGQTHKNLEQAKYVVDLLGMIEEKTAGNLSVDEAQMLKDTLYQLRMRYLYKSENK